MRCCIRTFVLIITCLCRFQSRHSYYCVSSLQLMYTHACKGASSLSLQAASPRLPHRSKVCRGCPCHWQLYLKGVPPTAPAWCPSVPLQPRGEGGLFHCAGAPASFLHTASWNSLWAAAMNITETSPSRGMRRAFTCKGLPV